MKGVLDATTGVTEYLGIRFAQPPTGSLRWTLATQLMGGDCYWGNSTPLNANDAGPACTSSEDCLRLNVYTPPVSEAGQPRPVLFWIYGGSNVYGSNIAYTNLTTLATDLDVVVVAPNYRLNALGYLALRELSQRSPTGTSGNYGISDLVAALQWVQRNINAFGGDPSAVTLLGQSSGGTNIFALLSYAASNPSSALLFHRVISLSGSGNLSRALNIAEMQNTHNAIATSSCANATDLYACLMALSSLEANSLFGDSYNTNIWSPCIPAGCSSPKNPNLYLALPIVDGVLLKYSVKDAMPRLPKGIDVVLFQSNQGEGDLVPDQSILEEPLWSQQQFIAFMNQTFITSLGYDGANFSRLLGAYLIDPTLATHQEVYQALLADYGVTFAQRDLASRVPSPYTKGFVGYVRCKPANPVPTAVVLHATMPFHMWDYMAGTGSFDMLSTMSPSTPGYTPAPSDLALGAQLRAQWARVVRGQSPWDDTAPAVGVIDCEETKSVSEFRSDVEELWRNSVTGPWEDVWWIN